MEANACFMGANQCSLPATSIKDSLTPGLCLTSNGGSGPTFQSCPGGGGGGGSFSAITSGTNTAAAMLVGTGAQLAPSGSGSIVASTMGFNGLTTANLNTSQTLTVGTGSLLQPNGTGVINANQLGGAAVGTTTPLAQGDLLIANATPALTRLPIGANTFVLTSNGTTASWVAGSIAFSTITGSTNTTAAMVVGSGATLDVTGTGSILGTTVSGSTNSTPRNWNITGATAPVLSVDDTGLSGTTGALIQVKSADTGSFVGLDLESANGTHDWVLGIPGGANTLVLQAPVGSSPSTSREVLTCTETTPSCTIPTTWTVGAGGALGTSGGGTIAATSVPSSGITSPGSLAIAGDVTGTLAASTVAKINGNPLGSTTPTDAQILIANGTLWQRESMSNDATIADTGAVTVAGINGHNCTSSADCLSQYLYLPGRTSSGQTVNGQVRLDGTTLANAGLDVDADALTGNNAIGVMVERGVTSAPVVGPASAYISAIQGKNDNNSPSFLVQSNTSTITADPIIVRRRSFGSFGSESGVLGPVATTTVFTDLAQTWLSGAGFSATYGTVWSKECYPTENHTSSHTGVTCKEYTTPTGSAALVVNQYTDGSNNTAFPQGLAIGTATTFNLNVLTGTTDSLDVFAPSTMTAAPAPVIRMTPGGMSIGTAGYAQDISNDSTWLITGAPSAIGTGGFVRDQTNWQNSPSGTARTLTGIYSHAADVHVTADNAAITMNAGGGPAMAGFWASATLSRINGTPSSTLAQWLGFATVGTAQVNTGWTVTDWKGFSFTPPGTVTGTITNMYGLDLADMTGAGTNLTSIRSAGPATMRHAGPAIFGSSSTVPTQPLQVTGAATTSGIETIDTTGTLTGLDPTLVLNPAGVTIGSAGSFAAIQLSSTQTINNSPGVGFTGEAFYVNPTYQNDSGNARTTTGFVEYAAAETYKANGAALTMNAGFGIPASAGFFAGPTWSRATATTQTDAAYVGFDMAAATIGVGWTITNYTGFLYTTPTINGAVGTQVAYDIASDTGGTTNVAYRNSSTADSRLLGDVVVGSSSLASNALLHVTGGTIANNVQRLESGASGTPLPSQRTYFTHTACPASTATAINFSLTGNAPNDAPCPTGTTCVVDTLVVCHCTSGSACTSDGGAAIESKWLFKNNSGTIAQIGSTASGFILGENVASLTSTYVTSGAAFITSIVQTLSTPNIVNTVTIPVNSAMECNTLYTVTPTGT